jgi:hypothetical protein
MCSNCTALGRRQDEQDYRDEQDEDLDRVEHRNSTQRTGVHRAWMLGKIKKHILPILKS